MLIFKTSYNNYQYNITHILYICGNAIVDYGIKQNTMI